MRFKKVSKGRYASPCMKYAIVKTFDGKWSVYKDIGRTDNKFEYKITFKFLKDAKKYVENEEIKSTLIEKIPHASVCDIEEFLGYQISADVLESGLEDRIKEILDSISKEELLYWEERFTK